MVGPPRVSIRPMAAPTVTYFTFSTLLRVPALRMGLISSVKKLALREASWSRLCRTQVKLATFLLRYLRVLFMLGMSRSWQALNQPNLQGRFSRLLVCYKSSFKN